VVVAASYLNVHIACRVGQNHIYIYGVHGISGREITRSLVIYSVYIYGFGQT
jgi:hypothetical protein